MKRVAVEVIILKEYPKGTARFFGSGGKLGGRREKPAERVKSQTLLTGAVPELPAPGH